MTNPQKFWLARFWHAGLHEDDSEGFGPVIGRPANSSMYSRAEQMSYFIPLGCLTTLHHISYPAALYPTVNHLPVRQLEVPIWPK